MIGVFLLRLNGWIGMYGWMQYDSRTQWYINDDPAWFNDQFTMETLNSWSSTMETLNSWSATKVTSNGSMMAITLNNSTKWQLI